MDVTVQPVPAGHPYTVAVTRPEPNEVRLLSDPVIDPADPGRWWPHPALEPQFYAGDGAGTDVDVLHLHFGFEHLGEDGTARFVRALADNDVRLVLTVHDLDNPHLGDQTKFHRQLAILTAAADHVITLSAAAAEVVRDRYGRDAEVLPHPPIAAAGAHPAARPGQTPDWSGRTERAGVFLKSLRGNVVADPAFYRDLAAEVYLHDDVDAPALAGLADHRHPPMDDAALFDAIAGHRVVVLPYLRGTHSGWLRMCRDLGTSVAVPDCGCYASQAGTDEGVATYRTGDGADAARAVAKLLEQGPAPAPPVDAGAVRRRHHEIYRSLVNPTAETERSPLR